MGDTKLGDGIYNSIDGSLVCNAKRVNYCMLYHGDSQDSEGNDRVKGCKPVVVRDRLERVGDTRSQAGEYMRPV
eukprot:15103082-Ditylum_brightwellii.AAC.1